MRRALALLMCATLLTACASRESDGDITSLDDPKFVSWYKTASPYARTALFVTLCAAQGFSNGAIEINFCISNMRRDARISVEGRL